MSDLCAAVVGELSLLKISKSSGSSSSGGSWLSSRSVASPAVRRLVADGVRRCEAAAGIRVTLKYGVLRRRFPFGPTQELHPCLCAC